MKEIKCPKCGEIFQIDDSSYLEIVKQISEKELEKRVKEKEKTFEKQKNQEIANVKLQSEMELQKLNMIIEQSDTQKQLAVEEALKSKELEIQKLKTEIEQNDTKKQLEIKEAVQVNELLIAEKEQELTKLKGELESSKKDFQIKEKNIQERYKEQLKLKDEEIAQYKDFKAKQSVKLLGETLEQHCEIEFNKIRAAAFPKSYFEKDNDIKTGSKGDYIFRELDDDETEIVSIMFEMKNEADISTNKKKNEDFFKELDKDRKEKNCEYAVLVSMLEADSEYYNSGIVDVSHRYEKMYVVRPQFFIPIITLIRNAALKSLDMKRSLIAVQNQNLDIMNFENNMNDFKEKFARNYSLASDKFKDAVDEIDKTIKHLQKVKESLLGSENQLRLANEKAESLSIKKLTHNSPTVRAMFDKLNPNQE